MELNIFTCECLLDHLIMMRNESEKKIVTKIFSITDRCNIKCITRLHSENNIYIFCLRCLNILRPFMQESVLCLKRSRSGLFNYVWIFLIVGLNIIVEIAIGYLLLILKNILLK